MLAASTVIHDDIHTRSRLAGYQPDVLHQAAVLVVGLGALGQNVVQTLALSGVGRLMLIDFDMFEPHNATRSPFFPVEAPAGQLKAPAVAHRCAEIATAPAPEVRYASAQVQQIGDGPISWADLVVSAVDSVSTRAWLAERSRLHGKPMAEGGFSGSRFNFSLFSGQSGRACYRCHNPYRQSSGSCARYAMRAAAASIVPAIQSTAATLSGFMAEQIIQALHGMVPPTDERFYGDVRARTLHQSRLQTNPHCPGLHEPAQVFGAIEGAHLTDVRAELVALAGPGSIVLPEPLLLDFPCVNCGRMCAVAAAESAWLVNSRCTECDGPWSPSTALVPASVTTIAVPDDLADTSPLTRLPVAELGLRPGGWLLYDGTAGRGLVSVAGDFTGGVELVVDRRVDPR